MKIEVSVSELFDVFFWGCDYGQLLMEEERASEEMFDAVICYHSSRKFNVPSAPARRRQLHSDKWFAAKKQGWENLNQFIKSKQGETNAG